MTSKRSSIASTAKLCTPVAAFVLVAGCGDDPIAPPTPASVVAVAPTTQSGTVGTAVADRPAVKVTTASGQPVPNVSVTFAVASGGGSVTGTTPITDADGVAVIGGWTLGRQRGENRVTATAGGLPAVTFTAMAAAGPPAELAKVSGDDQTAAAGEAAPVPVTVRVRDGYGNPVSSATVTFAVASGGGSVAPTTVTTDAEGRASATWTLGSVGTNTITASVAGAPTVTFQATAQAAKGSIRLVAATTGDDIPSGSFEARVDAKPYQLPANGAVVIEDLAPGAHQVQLVGLPAYCTVAGGSFRAVSVAAGATTEAAFALTCTRRIAFASNGDIYTVRSDGSGVIPLIAGPQYEHDPAWSPDGSRIAYVVLASAHPSANTSLWVANADGSHPRELTASGNWRDATPSWSPDGARIVFARGPDDEKAIHVIDADGSNLVTLTDWAENSHLPAWSPDGSTIAYSRFVYDFPGSNNGTWEIWAMNADGSQKRRLQADGWAPSWSPDGSKIVFQRMPGPRNAPTGPWDIYRMNVDGTDIVRLTEQTGDNHSPDWSPNGLRIAFVSHRDGASRVYLMATDGSGQTRVTEIGAAQPDWEP